MYGMPDSFIGNSTRKAIRMATRGNSKSYQPGWGGVVARWLYKKEAKKREQLRLQKLERKHKVSFS